MGLFEQGRHHGGVVLFADRAYKEILGHVVVQSHVGSDVMNAIAGRPLVGHGLAFINTQIGGAFAGVTWMILDWLIKKKPSKVGFCVGAVAGLATITPAAGFVTPQGAMLIGILAGSIPYAAVVFRQKKNWDDALDVWGVHGVGGTVGILALGLLATKEVNPDGADGLFYGNSSFFLAELVGVVVAISWAFIVTYVLLWVINRITPVRVSEADERGGLDSSLHGETAYIHTD